MNDIEKEFIPYQQSLDMKELGFDEPCFGIHFEEGLNPFLMFASQYGEEGASANGGILAPTFSQAFRFFRKKYKLHQNIEQYCGEKFYFNIKDMVHPRRWNEYPVKILETFNESDSQEEAELECLKKLIEIVKSGSLKA